MLRFVKTTQVTAGWKKYERGFDKLKWNLLLVAYSTKNKEKKVSEKFKKEQENISIFKVMRIL